MKYKSIFLIMLIFCQCAVKDTKHFEQKQIIGEWTLVGNQINYPIIEFYSDSTAIFKSKADTLYRFSFVLHNDSLVLQDINHKHSVNKLKVLNKTSLIFYNLLENSRQQRYKRGK